MFEPLGSSSVPVPLSVSLSFFGPRLVAAVVQGLETGIIINQSVQFWARQGGEKFLMKSLVFYVTIVSSLQTLLWAYEFWDTFFVNMNKGVVTMAYQRGMPFLSISTLILSAPIRAFFIHRCYLISERNRIVLASLIVLWLGSMISAIHFIGVAFGADYRIEPVDPNFTLSLTFSAVLDLVLTGIMLKFLMQSRSRVVTTRFRKVLMQLIDIVWEAALPPCICTILAIVTYVTLSRTSAWDILFQAVLGQLYVISLFVTINGFRDVRSKELGVSPETALEGSWKSISGGIKFTMQDSRHATSAPSAAFIRHSPVHDVERYGRFTSEQDRETKLTFKSQ